MKKTLHNCFLYILDASSILRNLLLKNSSKIGVKFIVCIRVGMKSLDKVDSNMRRS